MKSAILAIAAIVLSMSWLMTGHANSYVITHLQGQRVSQAL